MASYKIIVFHEIDKFEVVNIMSIRFVEVSFPLSEFFIILFSGKRGVSKEVSFMLSHFHVGGNTGKGNNGKE